MKYSLQAMIFSISSVSCVWQPALHEVPPPEGERVAVEIARVVFARTHGALPDHDGEIIWTDDDCIYVDWHETQSACASGAYYTYNDKIYVVARRTIGASSLAHELCHYWLKQLDGDPDHRHTKLEWWSIVPLAKEAIKRWEQPACYIDGVL